MLSSWGTVFSNYICAKAQLPFTAALGIPGLSASPMLASAWVQTSHSAWLPRPFSVRAGQARASACKRPQTARCRRVGCRAPDRFSVLRRHAGFTLDTGWAAAARRRCRVASGRGGTQGGRRRSGWQSGSAAMLVAPLGPSLSSASAASFCAASASDGNASVSRAKKEGTCARHEVGSNHRTRKGMDGWGRGDGQHGHPRRDDGHP